MGRRATTPKLLCDLAKEWGHRNGYIGRAGWIYKIGGDKAVAMGWSDFGTKHKTEILDWITQIAARCTFQELLNAPGNYRPTLRANLNWRYGVLADAYDYAQEQRGDARRAYRGN